MAQTRYEKRAGTRVILGTNFPVNAIATGAGRNWASFLLCNRTIESRRQHTTFRDAKLRAEYLARPDYDPTDDAESWPV